MKKNYISPTISLYHINSESLLTSASKVGATDYTGKDYDSEINGNVGKTDGKDLEIEMSKDNGYSLWDFDEE